MNKETIKNHRLVRKVYYFLYGGLKRKALLARARKVIDSFGIRFDKEDLIANDMVRCYRSYGFGFDEYLCYKFYEKSKAEREKFVADWEHLGYTCAMNDPANASVFDDKWKTYNTYKRFYKREIVFCQGESSKSEFVSFVEKHPRFIAKPLDASCGNGVAVFECKEDAEQLFARLLDNYTGRFIIEEIIIQAQEVAEFHPSSVNTVRVPTIRMDDETLIIHPFFRLGRRGKVVDNAGAGGVICSVDANTGRVFAAADEYAQAYEVHPDTDKPIIDFVIPRWEEARQLVFELAQVLPSNRYTGWDLALTDDGWVLVEANRCGQFVWQIPMQQGFREEINGILKRLGKKY